MERDRWRSSFLRSSYRCRSSASASGFSRSSTLARTASFNSAKCTGTTPGFYLLAGPNWEGDIPKEISRLFRSSTNTGFIAPRVFQDDTPEDKKAIQPVLREIVMYPLSEFDGRMKSIDWTKIPHLPAAASGESETQWVVLEQFFDELSAVLDDAPPLPGEEARYAQVRALLEAAKADKQLKAAMVEAAKECDAQIVKPLFEISQLRPTTTASLEHDFQ